MVYIIIYHIISYHTMAKFGYPKQANLERKIILQEFTKLGPLDYLTMSDHWNHMKQENCGWKVSKVNQSAVLGCYLKGLSTTSSSRAVMGPRIYQSHKKWIVADACGFGVLQTGHFIYWLLDKTHLDHSWSIPRDVVHKFNSPLMHLQAGTKWAPLGWLMQHSTLSDVNVLPKLVRHLVTSSWPNLVAMFTTLA